MQMLSSLCHPVSYAWIANLEVMGSLRALQWTFYIFMKYLLCVTLYKEGGSMAMGLKVLALDSEC